MKRLLRLALLAFAAFAAPAAADTLTDAAKHLGVPSCAGNNCHGAIRPLPNSHVPQNEYFIWAQKDKHARAYAALTGDRGKRIARNLGLPDAEHATLCLDCHADNIPPERRGPQFQLADGVGCETCHGGAEPWLGTHLSGAGHQANLAAGLYPTDRPEARAERCLSCHVGDDRRFVAHKIMGAGHPPMPFELDTFTAIQPAHFVVDDSYVERKGRPDDIRIWAVGQAVDVKMRMDLILDAHHAPKGVDYELSLFDCQSCHHAMSDLQWRARSTTALPPGRIKLYDATTMMLTIVAATAAPDKAGALRDRLLALHAATGDNWDAVRREAVAIRDIATALIPVLGTHQWTKAEAIALARAAAATALDGGDLDYSGAQQQVMALESIVAAMKQFGFADDTQLGALNEALKPLYAAVADDQKYNPDTYVEALKAFAAKLPS